MGVAYIASLEVGGAQYLSGLRPHCASGLPTTGLDLRAHTSPVLMILCSCLSQDLSPTLATWVCLGSKGCPDFLKYLFLLFRSVDRGAGGCSLVLGSLSQGLRQEVGK